MTSHVDLFLKAANPGERAQTLVVRGAITVPTEGKRAALTDTHAALEARQETISRLLGDAENPAHTRWNEQVAIGCDLLAPPAALAPVTMRSSISFQSPNRLAAARERPSFQASRAILALLSSACRAYLKTRVPIGRGAITVPTEGKRAALTETPSARAF
jgi:hypothetical protein